MSETYPNSHPTEDESAEAFLGLIGEEDKRKIANCIEKNNLEEFVPPPVLEAAKCACAQVIFEEKTSRNTDFIPQGQVNELMYDQVARANIRHKLNNAT